jgi:predicted transcriptional regulator of viral defense system
MQDQIEIGVTTRILSLASQKGILRPKNLVELGVSREMLRYLSKKGLMEHVGRGLYRLPGHLTEHESLLMASALVPQGVLCLLTALRFHEIGTQEPFAVWMALPPKAWRPRIQAPELRIVRYSGKALTEGVEEHRVPGGKLRVYSSAKTVVDTFKYRNKIGLDVALEALRECLMDKKATIDQLWHFAGVCRVQRVMRPYLEALT